MSAELLINVTPQETRVSLIDHGVLQEVFVERDKRRGLVGGIYKGKVCRVLPGMQAAFVDIGLDRAAFLHASDVANSPLDSVRNKQLEDTYNSSVPSHREPAHSEHLSPNGITHTNISALLREGQELLVQVIKDPLGSKGARLTTYISIPSVYLVYMPDGGTIGVSQRIEDEQERDRLRDMVKQFMPQRSGANSSAVAETDGAHLTTGDRECGDGYILRTAAESVSPELLRADMEFLHKLWLSTQEKARNAKAPSAVHQDLPLVIRTLRELTSVEIERARIDSRDTRQEVLEFAEQFLPEMASRIEFYDGERPIFDLYGVDDEIQKALQRKVTLKSGGHLVFDQTEAMTTIDVNTGAYVGHRNLEETIFKTNLEATQAIARQLRLRNLGGIIIIDFIDMESEEHKRQVLRALEKSLERDHTKSHISSVSPLGLVEMTRKRTRESLEHVLCEPCPTCNGRGSIKTPDTVCYEIFREILREARQYESEKLLVLASPEVVDALIDEESANFAELEASIGKPIRLQVEAMYQREQYDVVLL